MKTILVPTDFTEYAKPGVLVAAQIAAQTGSPIVLLHNVNSQVNWEGLSDSERLNWQEIQTKTTAGERKLNDLINGDFDSDLTVSKMITHGITHHEIISKAKELSADLIVMGSHGNDPDRFFIGSNIQKVIRFATCPVLAAKKAFVGGAAKKIVFPSSFDFDLHKPFREILKLANALGSTIHLLYVNTPAHFKNSRTIKEEMREFIGHYPDQKFEMAIYNQKDPVEGILEYSQEIDADLIAMVTRDRRHSPKYIVGSTELLVSHADIPVLSINEKIFEPVLM